MKIKAKEVKAQSAWLCDSCGIKKGMSYKQVLSHLKSKHGLNTKGLRCSKKMLSHMDGDTWFSYTWKVTVGKVELLHKTINPRSFDDPMRYA